MLAIFPAGISFHIATTS